jgi:hypothetical protein
LFVVWLNQTTNPASYVLVPTLLLANKHVYGVWIRHSIEEYAGLSQQVMQLTTIISESMKQLPETRGANR